MHWSVSPALPEKSSLPANSKHTENCGNQKNKSANWSILYLLLRLLQFTIDATAFVLTGAKQPESLGGYRPVQVAEVSLVSL